MFILSKPSVKSLTKAINILIEDPATTEELCDDLFYSLDRLKSAPKGSKILDVHKEKVPDSLKVEEGYWIINGTAHYLCIPRN